MSPPPQPIDIAIIGGGIAGVLLTIGLLKRGVHVALYESARAFGEIGAGVGFGPSAVRAMVLLDPAVHAGFERCATFNEAGPGQGRNAWIHFRRGMHCGVDPNKDQCELIGMLETPEGSAAMHRAHFLDEVVKLIPDGVARFGKRLEEIDNLPDGRVRLHFKDGSEAVHAAVVGCDGIRSRTRQIVLGENDPAAKAVFSGKYAYRGLVPMDKAAALLGDDFARKAQMYAGYHGHVFTNPIEKGATMNVAAVASKQSWDDPNWAMKATQEEFGRDFAGWSEHVRSIIALVGQASVWALFHHLPARIYTRDRICLLGDAAHASTPHQGSGAVMAVEDAYVLSSLLGEVQDASQIQAAFDAYEKVRIERTQKVVTTSAETGNLYGFELPEVGDDVQKIGASLKTRMRWIWDEDVLMEFEQAKALFEEAIYVL